MGLIWALSGQLAFEIKVSMTKWGEKSQLEAGK